MPVRRSDAVIRSGIVLSPASRDDAQFIAHAREDIPALLDALDAETARADKAEVERDRLAARCAALERALYELAPCLSCVRETPGNRETCGNCEVFLEGSGVKGWQFDETRYLRISESLSSTCKNKEAGV